MELNDPNKVTVEEFFKIIYDKKLDVIIKLTGEHPYKSTFRFRNGELFGWIEPGDKEAYYYDVKSYHIGK